MVELQARDIKLLKTLNKFGALNVRGLQNFYGKEYYKQRLLKLKEENYVIGKHGFVTLGYKSKEILKELNIEINPPVYDKSKARKLSKIAGIYTELDNWEIQNSQAVKTSKNLNQVCQTVGSLTNDRKEEFIVYHLDNRLNKKQLTYAQYEIKSLDKNICTKVIIFINSFKIIQQMPINALRRHSLLLVPTGKLSIKLLNEYGSKDINMEVLQLLKNASTCSNSLFEYEDQSNYYTSLLLIDIAKMEYLNSFASNFTHKKINVFCLRGMEQYYKTVLHENINILPIEYKTCPSRKGETL
ncbi:hypothetical protein N494_18940 (plasmid) [Clostridium botulinum A2B7 92]|uniref:hypothetical protein n=1 Tax=Clostridium botulinum TaxID=1491 RepID=UPI0007E0C6FF|nr:hypothetical protein [Clostridium botulinum]KEI94187.1 hypothetical protein N494_18940 [Clostridium botulinum A2B7 92]